MRRNGRGSRSCKKIVAINAQRVSCGWVLTSRTTVLLKVTDGGGGGGGGGGRGAMMTELLDPHWVQRMCLVAASFILVHFFPEGPLKRSTP
jgi:hypothetical protein